MTLKIPPLTDKNKEDIVELWKMGFGAGTIGIKLKLHATMIQTYLKNNGYRRSHAEAVRMNKKYQLYKGYKT